GAEWLFNLHTFLFAARTYAQLSKNCANSIQWDDCGVLTLDSAFAKTRRVAQDSSFSHYAKPVMQRLNAETGSMVSGLTLTQAGVFFPAGGRINPAALCAFYL